jgi:very-short-patch-repair endonuclease
MRKRKSTPLGFDGSQIKVAELIADGKQTAAESLEHDFAWSMERCESPIEKLFAVAMIHPRTAREFDTRVELLNPKSGRVEHCQAPPMAGIYMWQQIQIGPYRVDFLLDYEPGSGLPPLIVEVDGHEFHERTKEQAQRDKARDRFLVGRNYRLVRFTGSEIYADPMSAADQAIAILIGIAP